ncbi:2-component transcriptional regulator [Klebsiella quasipneumoniae]|nr:2-component transcriptional regulator [Klebsiella quasipneumoniae]
MTNFLINIKNHYLRVAIAELVDEAMKTYGGSEYQFSQQWNADGMAQANVIFTEMVAGEWYLCHDLFQHAPEQYTLFIFQDNEQATAKRVYPTVCGRRCLCLPTLPFSFLKMR